MADFSDDKLNEIVDSGYEFRSSEYISKAFAIFKQTPGSYIGFVLLAFVVLMILGIIPLVNILANFLSPVLFAGIYIVSQKIDTNQNFEFSNFFDGFKRNPGQIILASILMGLIACAAAIPMIVGLVPMMMSGTEPGAMFFLGLLVSMVIIFYLMVSWIFTVQFIIFHNMQAWQAMQASMKLVKGKWWSVFGFIIMLGFMNMLGALCLLVGLLVTMPVSQIAMYTAFSDVTRMNEDAQMDIMDHLVDEDSV
ncbi:MAG: glycerophosphoryl diester phosphodiesterase membrane domain-containing protein [Bacteroidota bacterium]